MPTRKRKTKKTKDESEDSKLSQESLEEKTETEETPAETIPKPINEDGHTSEEEARNSVYQGALDMQNALFTHASFTSGRLLRIRSILGKVETKIFDDTFIDDLDKKEMLKLYELVKGTERDSLDYLERTHKIIQDSPNVVKVTQTFVSNRPHRGSDSISGRIDRNLISQIKQRLLTDTMIAQDALAGITDLEDNETIDIEETNEE
jgi:hypothetical protein